MSVRGLAISLIAGLLMGSFYPFVSRAMTGYQAPGPYAITFFFSLGVALCALPMNPLLMRIPLDRSAAVPMRGYWQAEGAWHLWGFLGGAVWCTGAVFNFVASRAHVVGPAVSYSIGQGATMISAAWGVFVWREFAAAPRNLGHCWFGCLSFSSWDFLQSHSLLSSRKESRSILTLRRHMQARQKPVVIVGSVNTDLVANTKRIPVEGETVLGDDFQIHPRGKGANQAVAVARRGYPVRLIARLGDDAFGTQLRRHLEQAGVDTAGLMTSPGTSGVAVIVVAENGENSIVITPGANALLTPDDLDREIEMIRSAGVVLTQLEIPLVTVEHLVVICVREGIPLILDPAPAKELSANLLENVSWFTPNETEAAFYLGEKDPNSNGGDPSKTAQLLLSKGVKGVILKLGSRGAYIQSRSGSSHAVTSFAVKAIDTTAAGDAFNGAFATALLLGMDAPESARFACTAAALSVTRSGAQPSMPAMTEVEALLSRTSAGSG